MFCTNCGEEMRTVDKFCANCGSAAAPRPVKTRAAVSTPVERARAAESAAAPLPSTLATPARAGQPQLGFATATSQAAAAAPPPLSRQQEQQALLEAEEIASVRGMLPLDALPEEFPPAAPAPAPTVARTQVCGSCGAPNPADNYFCERCGKALQAAAQVVAAPAPVRAPVPSPITQTGWLDVPEPKASAAAARVPVPAMAKAAAAPVPAAAAKAKDADFFYFYDDASPARGSRKLLIVAMVVLALGVLGVIYLLSRPSSKTVAGANVTVTVSPTETEIAVGEAHDFSATVSGTGDTDVNWSIAEAPAGGTIVNRGVQAQGGTVAVLGRYVAPNIPGTYHLMATSKADPSKSASAEVLVSGK